MDRDTQDIPIAPIVVGYDGSDGADQALRWAAEEAERRHQALNMLCAWQPPALPDPFALSMEVQLREAAHLTVEAASARTHDQHPGLDIGTTVVTGPPARALVDASRKADLLVVGSHGNGRFAGLLLGSVSLHCSAHATCPVVVVPAPA